MATTVKLLRLFWVMVMQAPSTLTESLILVFRDPSWLMTKLLLSSLPVIVLIFPMFDTRPVNMCF